MLGELISEDSVIDGKSVPKGSLYIKDTAYRNGKGREIFITRVRGYIKDIWGDFVYMPDVWEGFIYHNGKYSDLCNIYEDFEIIECCITTIIDYIKTYQTEFYQSIEDDFIIQYNYLTNTWGEGDVNLIDLLVCRIMDNVRLLDVDYQQDTGISAKELGKLLLEYFKADEYKYADKIAENMVARHEYIS